MSQNILVLVDNVITRAGAKLYLKAEMPPSQAAIIWSPPASPVHIRAHIRSRYSNNVFIYTLSSVTVELF